MGFRNYSKVNRPSVILSDGKIVRRHVDNIKARYNATTNGTNGSEFDLAFQSEPEPTENTAF